ncbi:hypothetical protein EVAR_60545_1 [Eumeta japonica]|uniref:Uncharacterized protein n=1 Tax=Eumeta variegata TaxID=151549 RepID=A0A4C1YQV7_EUMVA|nr:hypothetical protein EVAR_60545_1 [Eumeta japonica]
MPDVRTSVFMVSHDEGCCGNGERSTSDCRGQCVCARAAREDGTLNGEAGVVETKQDRYYGYLSCVKRLTLPWRRYENTVALNVQRSWGGGIERDRSRVNAWHSNACA